MLELHTDPLQGNVMGTDPAQNRSNALQGGMSSMQGNMDAGGTAMTPMQADRSNMALIPQRPEHIMLRQQEIGTIEGPAGNREVTDSSVRGLLARNLGYYVVASFLMGTQQAIQWEGILASVGNDYLVIYQPDQNRFVSGDIYALKFVEFHEDQSACAGYRRRDTRAGKKIPETDLPFRVFFIAPIPRRKKASKGTAWGAAGSRRAAHR